MGAIARSLVEMKAMVRELLKDSRDINLINLYDEVCWVIYKCLNALRPLLKQTIELNDKLVVGDWFYYRDLFNKEVGCSYHLYLALRLYGDVLVEHARDDIKPVLEGVVSLARELKDYPRKVTVKVSAPFEYVTYNYAIVRGIATRLTIVTTRPDVVHVTYWSDETKTRTSIWIRVPMYATVVEDLYPHLATLYEKARKRIGSIRSHNKKVLRKMVEVALPYVLAAELGREV